MYINVLFSQVIETVDRVYYSEEDGIDTCGYELKVCHVHEVVIAHLYHIQRIIAYCNLIGHFKLFA